MSIVLTPVMLPQFYNFYCCSCILCIVFHIYLMSPALLCKSSVQSGNAEQCTLAFIHLLSSSCTSYFYNISYMSVPIVNASIWWYSQPHSECILSDPSPIIIIIIHIVSCIVLVVQLMHLFYTINV